jgi:hypothetical protein
MGQIHRKKKTYNKNIGKINKSKQGWQIILNNCIKYNT